MNEAAQASEIQVGGQTYRCGKLSAIQQFHVSRRLGPVLIVAGISVDTMRRGLKAEPADYVAMAGPVMHFIAQMEDADVNYIMRRCLSAVQRAQGNAWAPVLVAGKDGEEPQLTFMDIDMPAMVRLTLEVVQHNLAGFLTGLGDETTTPSPKE